MYVGLLVTRVKEIQNFPSNISGRSLVPFYPPKIVLTKEENSGLFLMFLKGSFSVIIANQQDVLASLRIHKTVTTNDKIRCFGVVTTPLSRKI